MNDLSLVFAFLRACASVLYLILSLMEISVPRVRGRHSDQAGHGVREDRDVTGHRPHLRSCNHDDSIPCYFPGGGCWSMLSLSGVAAFPKALALASCLLSS